MRSGVFGAEISLDFNDSGPKLNSFGRLGLRRADQNFTQQFTRNAARIATEESATQGTGRVSFLRRQRLAHPSNSNFSGLDRLGWVLMARSNWTGASSNHMPSS